MRLLGNSLIDGYVKQLPDYINAVDGDDKKSVKYNEYQKFMATLFLHNANHERFGDMLMDYRKEFSSKEINYSDNLKTVMDVMRQQPIKKKKKVSILQKHSREREGERGRGSIKFCHNKRWKKRKR